VESVKSSETVVGLRTMASGELPLKRVLGEREREIVLGVVRWFSWLVASA
jgi:hypothetical protein